MSDNLKNRGQQDRSRVNSEEKWEVSYMREKYNVDTRKVEEAVKAVGNDRQKVEEWLQKNR
jgi:hypothetical protein